ncbi:MAG: sulfotransferase domain-containing protein, partial [Actinomycetota bacterium]|nr:sulfotransferase domain-containing protein [Actinomycetota bacterium]
VSVARTVARPTAGTRPLPDYLIVGGQRCGTTSLHHYLVQHPAVLPARFTKGVHWFDVAFDKPESWYRSNFATGARRRSASERLGQTVVTGEASPYYLFHPEVPGRVAALKPEMKIIAVLRDPIERAWSHYHHERARGFEDLDFEAALDAEDGRLAGAELVLAAPDGRHFSHQHHSYVARGRYAEQLKRWERHIPADQTLVLLSTDLQDDTEATMAGVHRFLGLTEEPTATGRRWNKQSNPELSDRVRDRLQAAFSDGDRQLAARLGRRLPWAEHSPGAADG